MHVRPYAATERKRERGRDLKKKNVYSKKKSPPKYLGKTETQVFFGGVLIFFFFKHLKNLEQKHQGRSNFKGPKNSLTLPPKKGRRRRWRRCSQSQFVQIWTKNEKKKKKLVSHSLSLSLCFPIMVEWMDIRSS